MSPLDPAMFSTIEEFATELQSGGAGARYSPADVAGWLEGFARGAREHLAEAAARVKDARDPAFRRVAIDVEAYCGVGLFFAWKLRAGIAWALWEKNGDVNALRDAVAFYRLAREGWASVVKATRGVYVDNLGFGQTPNRRGHWADRAAAIDLDLRYMERLLEEKAGGDSVRYGAAPAWLQPRPPIPECRHEAPAAFTPGEPLEVELAAKVLGGVTLQYRHVNHAEPYQKLEMTGPGGRWRGAIPAAYAEPVYPLIYYFELRDDSGHAWLYPGLGRDLAGQPYFVVRRAASIARPTPA